MSEYIPITQELRDLWYGRRVTDDVVTDASLEAHCDIIDALHKSLEKQNEELRKELKERPVACDAEVMAFVDRLRDAAEMHEDVTLWGVDYTAMLMDADRVAIHVGDMMHGTCPSGKYVRGEVSAIGDNKFWLCNVQFSLHPGFMHHYHKPTVEDVLREFVTEFNSDDTELCDDDIIERFAKRLQLADGDDDE